MCSACGEERTAYVRRSPVLSANGAEQPKEGVLPDGTRVVFIDVPLEEWRAKRDAELAGTADANGGGANGGKGGESGSGSSSEEIRVERAGGVDLTNKRVEHLVANLMTCFRNREWETVWYQCLDTSTRERWQREKGGPEGFVEWCEANRDDLMAFLNRAGFGFLGSDVVLAQTAPNVSCIRFSPRISSQFKLSAIAMSHSDGAVWLLDIQRNADYVDPVDGKKASGNQRNQSNRP